jgi:hypothetical protein
MRGAVDALAAGRCLRAWRSATISALEVLHVGEAAIALSQHTALSHMLARWRVTSLPAVSLKEIHHRAAGIGLLSKTRRALEVWWLRSSKLLHRAAGIGQLSETRRVLQAWRLWSIKLHHRAAGIGQRSETRRALQTWRLQGFHDLMWLTGRVAGIGQLSAKRRALQTWRLQGTNGLIWLTGRMLGTAQLSAKRRALQTWRLQGTNGLIWLTVQRAAAASHLAHGLRRWWAFVEPAWWKVQANALAVRRAGTYALNAWRLFAVACHIAALDEARSQTSVARVALSTWRWWARTKRPPEEGEWLNAHGSLLYGLSLDGVPSDRMGLGELPRGRVPLGRQTQPVWLRSLGSAHVLSRLAVAGHASALQRWGFRRWLLLLLLLLLRCE